MKFKAKRNTTFRGKMFKVSGEYELNEDEQKIIGKFFDKVVDKAPEKVELKNVPIIPPAEEQEPKEEPKAKRK